MSSVRICVVTTSVLLACGCASPEVGRERPVNVWLVKSMYRSEAENAIIDQHTLFPYHFIEESAELSDAGRSDLAVLASHYLRYPGSLNVRRSGADEVLHTARVKTVTEYLASAHVEMEKMKISDDLPGGDGMESERVGVITNLGLANVGMSSESDSGSGSGSGSSAGRAGSSATGASATSK